LTEEMVRKHIEKLYQIINDDTDFSWIPMPEKVLEG